KVVRPSRMARLAEVSAAVAAAMPSANPYGAVHRGCSNTPSRLTNSCTAIVPMISRSIVVRTFHHCVDRAAAVSTGKIVAVAASVPDIVISLVDAVAPRRLGVGFRRLLASSWLSNTGDGIALAAGPLLVASLTHNAVLIASGATFQWLPPLLFGLRAGALSDRVNRRLIVVTVDLLRAAVLAVLSLTIATGAVSVWLVLGTLFAVATAEVFADNATSTLLPMLVSRDDLTLANARIQVGFITVTKLAGPPIGAALFTVGAAWPFAGQAVLVAFGAILLGRIVLPAHGRADGAGGKVWRDIVHGFRWAVRHPAVRTLVLTIFIFNITFGAAW